MKAARAVLLLLLFVFVFVHSARAQINTVPGNIPQPLEDAFRLCQKHRTSESLLDDNGRPLPPRVGRPYTFDKGFEQCGAVTDKWEALHEAITDEQEKTRLQGLIDQLK